MNMKRVFIQLLSIIIMFSASDAVAQRSKKKKKKKEEEVEVIEVYEAVEEEEVIIESTEEDYDSRSSNRVLTQGYYNFKRNYDTNNINDEYDWFYDKNSDYNSRKYGIVNNKGEVVLPNVFKYNSYSGDEYNKILYIDNKYGFYNIAERKWTIPIDKDYIESLSPNFLSVKKNGKYTIVDFNNKPVSDKQWYSVSKISSLTNYVRVSEKRNGETYYGAFSLLERKLVIPCEYVLFDRSYYNKNIFKVKDATTSKYNLVTINNKLLFSDWYDEITMPDNVSNRFIVKKDQYYGVLDNKERKIIPLTYKLIASSSYSDGSRISQNKEGKYGFMTLEGEVTLPFEYDYLDSRYSRGNNLISVKNSKCGIVRINSGLPQEIISCDYDDITNLNKILITKKEGKYGMLDGNGKTLVEPIYEDLEVLGSDSYYGDKTIKAKIKGKYIIFDDLGVQISDDKFKEIQTITDEDKSTSYDRYFTFYKVKKKDKFQIMDKVGNLIGDSAFEDITSEYKNIFIVKKEDKYGLFSLLDNELLIDYSYDLITKTKSNYLGINGNKIDILSYQRGKIVVKAQN
ncbi:hypothetical protein MHTCC0001_29030 [Flavobacteriaceae bacterium MHTCC 0001]